MSREENDGMGRFPDMTYSRGPGSGPSHGAAHRVTATVRWFNRTKGFGFVAASDGSGDIFLPAAALSQAGYSEVGEGTTIECDVVEGPKGRSVASVIDVDVPMSSQPPIPARSTQPDRLNPAAPGPAERLEGIVKWFDITRGFGFISPKDGGDDVFVHVSALRRSGLDMLVTGQAVRMLVQKSRRGREAATVELSS